MAKHSKTAKVPGAGKNNGKWSHPTVCPFTGMKLETPRVKFPKLELNGIAVTFTPGWDGNGKCAGWGIIVSNPIADALAAADNALAVTIRDEDTAGLWNDLIPTFRRGKECTLQVCCPAAMIRKFITQAERNGFKAVADDTEQTNGGAE